MDWKRAKEDEILNMRFYEVLVELRMMRHERRVMREKEKSERDKAKKEMGKINNR